MPVESRRMFIRAVMAYKIVHFSLQKHLVSLVQPWLASHKNGQRTALRNKLSIRLPRPKTDYLKRSIPPLCFPFRKEQIGTLFEMFCVLIIV